MPDDDRSEWVEEKFDKQLFRVHFEMRDNNPVHMPYQMKKTAPSQKSFIKCNENAVIAPGAFAETIFTKLKF